MLIGAEGVAHLPLSHNTRGFGAVRATLFKHEISFIFLPNNTGTQSFNVAEAFDVCRLETEQ